MSMRHSREDLTNQANGCTICREQISDNDDFLRTTCGHKFHRQCLLTWLKRNNSCPQCRAACTSRDFATHTGAKTRGRTAGQTAAQANTNVNEEPPSVPVQKTPPMEGATSITGGAEIVNTASYNASNRDEEDRIQTLVSAVISARQATMLDDFESRISQMIEQRLESSLNTLFSRLHCNNVAQPIADPVQAMHTPSGRESNPNGNRQPDNSTPFLPHDAPNIPNISNNNLNRQIDQFRFSNISSGPNTGRVAQLVSSWDLKFDGTSKLSVDSFIYRVESQVIDALNGNFTLFCEHVQSLFTGEAKEWYWRYRRSVDRIAWPSLCEALRTNFKEYRSDTDFKKQIRARKQGLSESFDDFKNSILRIAENLQYPLTESELVEIMQRNLRPSVRQQLLYVNIHSLAELRRLCLKGERLVQEISKASTSNQFATPNNNSRQFSQRKVSEVQAQTGLYDHQDVESSCDIDEISKRIKLKCWNCQKEGHRFFDCVEERTIFCYGCGAFGIYKPHCPTCNPGNGQKGEVSKANPRHDLHP